MFNKIDTILYISIALLIGIIILRLVFSANKKGKENMTTQYYSVLSDDKLINIEDVTLDNTRKVFNVDINNVPSNPYPIINNNNYDNMYVVGDGNAPDIWSGDSLVRATTTGLFAETGPLGHNVGSYEARLGGCNCPTKPSNDVNGGDSSENNVRKFHSSHFSDNLRVVNSNREGFTGEQAREPEPGNYIQFASDNKIAPPDNIIYTNQSQLMNNIKGEVEHASEKAMENQIEIAKRNAKKRFDAIVNALNSSIASKLNNLRESGYSEPPPPPPVGGLHGNSGAAGQSAAPAIGGLHGNNGNDGNDGQSAAPATAGLHGISTDGRDGVDGVDGVDGLSINVAMGTIVIWSGSISDIPEGWALCDGTEYKNDGSGIEGTGLKTPDLRDKFVLGAGGNTNGVKGGNKTKELTTSEMPSHKHTVNYRNPSHEHWMDSAPLDDRNLTGTGGPPRALDQEHGLVADAGSSRHYGGKQSLKNGGGKYTTSDGGNHNHSMSNAGDGNPFEIMPPWYKLAYIMKVGCRSKEKKEGNICVPRPGCYIKKSDNAQQGFIDLIMAKNDQSCKDRIEKSIYAPLPEGSLSDEKCKEQAQEWDKICGNVIGVTDISDTFGYEFIG